MRMSVVALCVLVLGVAGQLCAEPLNPKQVPADAKVVAHLDVDAMRVSVVAEKGYQACEQKCKAIGGQIEELRTLCQVVDPMTDLKGVTLYGTQFKKPGGVLIIHANFSDAALGSLYEAVQKQPGYSSSNHGAYELHSWTRGKDTPRQQNVTAVYVQPDRMVFGISVDEVKAALDVLDGSKPSIAGKSSLAADVPAGALLIVRAADLAAANLPIDSPIVKQSDVVGMILGENNNEAYLTGELFAKDAKAADDIKAAVESGLTSALLATDDADLANLINAVQVTSNDKAVSVDVRGPADMGWMYLEKLAAKVAEEGKKAMEANFKKAAEAKKK